MRPIKPRGERDPDGVGPWARHDLHAWPCEPGSRASWPAGGCWAGRSSSSSASSSRSPATGASSTAPPTARGADTCHDVCP